MWGAASASNHRYRSDGHHTPYLPILYTVSYADVNR